MTIEQLVKKYGEEHRRMIEAAITWLNQEEPKWKLDTPIDRDEYIQNLIDKVSKT